MQVLSSLLAFAVEEGDTASNPCKGLPQLYSSDRSEIIWTDADILALKQRCSGEVAHAVDLASHTGLRLGDLMRLCWSHIGDDAIVITTGKSKNRREAIVPLYDALRAVLERIPRRSTTVLVNSDGRPWKDAGSFATSFTRVKRRAGLGDLHFHDLRGTAATKFYLADLSKREIAEILGWSEGQVDRIIRRYVGRTVAVKAMIRRLNEPER